MEPNIPEQLDPTTTTTPSGDTTTSPSQNNPPGLKILPRDRGMLETVAKLKMALAEEIALVCGFASSEQARRRLEKFVQAGYLQKFENAFGQKHVYAIKRRGLNVANEESEYNLSHIKPPRDLDGNMDHLHAINTVRIAIAHQLPTAGGYLTWWRSDWEISKTESLVPDALFEIDWEGVGARVYALEVEQATRAPKILLSKILNYSSYKQQQRELYDARDFILLVACQSDDRLTRYHQSLHAITDKSWIWFASIAAIARAGLWKAADDGQWYPLCDLGHDRSTGQLRSRKGM